MKDRYNKFLLVLKCPFLIKFWLTPKDSVEAIFPSFFPFHFNSIQIPVLNFHQFPRSVGFLSENRSDQSGLRSGINFTDSVKVNRKLCSQAWRLLQLTSQRTWRTCGSMTRPRRGLKRPWLDPCLPVRRRSRGTMTSRVL